MIQKIAVVGNACAGKTTLSLKLAKIHSLPVTHVDSIQFLSGMVIRPHQESIQMLRSIESGEFWIIEGYGPLDMIEKRFQAADRVVFLDLPLWRLYYWSGIRQIKNVFSKRAELPDGCDELSIAQTRKLFRSIKITHQKMRPELLRIFARPNLCDKVIIVRTVAELSELGRIGLNTG
jgi:adenylate kinase family enzyme